MKEKRILCYLIAILSLCLLITACAKRGDQEESQPTAETSPSTSRTQVTAKETEPSPLETETEPSETQESDPSQSAQPDPSIEATTQVTSTSSTASTMTLPSYTVTTPQATTTTAVTTIKDLSKEYEAIYKDYAGRLRSKTPVLIKEYKEEAKANTTGAFGLGIIQTQKVAALTRIETEGTYEMTILRLRTNGDAADPAFDKWAGELGDVFLDELAKLRAAFD